MYRPVRGSRRGATMVLVAILLPALFALAALAINIAHMETISTEIQIAADAAARAAGRAYADTGDQAEALKAAQRAATENKIGDYVVPITASDLEFGVSTRASENAPYVFNATGSGNSVRLTTRTLSSGAGHALTPVFPFFGSTFEIRPERSAISTQGDTDVMLVVDRSGSMAYSSSEFAIYPPAPAAAPAGWDFGDRCPPNARWLDLIAAVNTFTQELSASPQDERLGLVTYNHEAEISVPLGTDYETSLPAELLDISMAFEAGGTNIGGGMIKGLAGVTDASFSRPHAAKVVVVMTDGVHNFGTSPTKAVRDLADDAVMVFTITFSDEADQSQMQEVAKNGGGRHFHAITAEQLRDAFREIARSLPTILTK